MTDWSDYSDDGGNLHQRYLNALEEYDPPDEQVEAMANLAEAAGNRRDARLLRTALRMRQCPKIDLDKLTRELDIKP